MAKTKNSDGVISENPTYTEKRLTKKSIVRSVKYGAYVDILESRLNDGELYSHEEVDKMIKDNGGA